jgi:hypothetical protein
MKMPGSNKPRCRVTDGFIIRPGGCYDSRIVPGSLRKRRNEPDREAVERCSAVGARLHTCSIETAAERCDPRVGVCQHQDGLWPVMPCQSIADELGLAAASRCYHQPTAYRA